MANIKVSMKVITIGREHGNDIVISDNYVGRRHIEIVRDDQGHFILKDLNSKNGTYVNGQRIRDEVYLQRNDIVRIGNTTLPWRSYFDNPPPPPPNKRGWWEKWGKKVFQYMGKTALGILIGILSMYIIYTVFDLIKRK